MRTVSSEGIAAGLGLPGDERERALAWASSSSNLISKRCFSICSLRSSMFRGLPSGAVGVLSSCNSGIDVAKGALKGGRSRDGRS